MSRRIAAPRAALLIFAGLVGFGQGAGAQAPAPPRPASDADPAAWPLSAVGKLNVITGPASRQHCTATLIGKRLVLTAAHCLYIKARKRWVDPADVHFVAGYALGRYTAHALARAYTKPDAYAYGTTAADLSRDWALVTLASEIPIRPLPISRAIGPDAKTLTFTGILHAGYKTHADQVISVERDCTARYRSGPTPLLGHSCRIVPGESGSALILMHDGGPAIIGVLVATASLPAPASLAVPASTFLAAAEAALAAAP